MPYHDWSCGFLSLGQLNWMSLIRVMICMYYNIAFSTLALSHVCLEVWGLTEEQFVCFEILRFDRGTACVFRGLTEERFILLLFFWFRNYIVDNLLFKFLVLICDNLSHFYFIFKCSHWTNVDAQFWMKIRTGLHKRQLNLSLK